VFEQILVAIDGSPRSRATLPAAIALAGQFDSEILVLHVSEHEGGRAAVYSLETHARATIMVADAVKMLGDLGRVARGLVRDVAAGHVAKAIVEVAEANGVDLIVIGSRAMSEVQGLLLGSENQDVTGAAGIPLLVIGPTAPESARHRRRLSSVQA
jgi:nucleotide-binding universal stress UspA family protein